MDKHVPKTKKQHFVPQAYLRSFYTNEKHTLCYLDVSIIQNYNKFLFKETGSKGVCWEEYLYELKNCKGDFLAPNYIENFLSKYENCFTAHKESLINNVKTNLHCGQIVLTEREMAYWLEFIAIQIIRSPRFIDLLSEIVSKLITPLPDYPKNFPILALLFPVLKEYKGKTIFDFLLNTWNRSGFSLGFLVNSTNTHFFTSEYPVQLIIDNCSLENMHCFMPITPTLGIALLPPMKTYLITNNLVVVNNREVVNAINAVAMSCAQKYVICDQFSNKDKEYIKNNFYRVKRQKYVSDIIFLLNNYMHNKEQKATNI